MLRGRDIKKRKRAARFTLEPLEDRVELSVGGGAAQVMAEVDAFNSQFETKFAQLDALVIHRTAQLDQGYEAALNQASSTDDGATTNFFDRAPRISRIGRSYNTFVRNIERRVNVLTRRADSEIHRITVQSSLLDPTSGPMVAFDSTQVRDSVAAIGNTLKGEAEAARDAPRGLVGSAHAAIFQASTYGLSARSEVYADDEDLTQVSQSQQAGDQAAYEALMGAYHNALNALQSQIATLPSSYSSSTTAAKGMVTLDTGTTTGLATTGMSTTTIGTNGPGGIGSGIL